MNRPLEGILVADFSRVQAGPLATMSLADLGATVVKVERPIAGDDTRAWGPPWTETSSAYFESVNRSKHSVTLDLTNEKDRRLARELARRADVLVENFRTGTLERYGLGYDAVRPTNPGIVYCTVSGFASGLGAALPGYAFVVQAVGGLMSITGDAEGEPRKAGVALVDVLTGRDAVIGILAALRAREHRGEGERIEVNLLSSLIGAMVNQASNFLTTGVSPRRMGNQHPSIAPYETLRCRDGLLAVACGNDGQFRRLAAVLGLPKLADDPQFATNPARVEHRSQLIESMQGPLAREDAVTWEQRLQDVDVPAGVVGDIGSAITRAERLGLHPTMQVGPGHPSQITNPVSYSRSELAPATPPPELCEHDAQVRAWLALDTGAPLTPPSHHEERASS